MVGDAPGIEAWKEQTSAFDRVRSVAGSVSKPRSASYIATEAYVAENTARNHLERLVEMNVLLESEKGGTSMYSPDPLHIRMQTLRDLLDTYDHDDLIRLKTDLQERI
ncbi:MAG: ArsR family transcriptional regulator, partial [Euryarchaeota archaeon]|nr:ArsR family transcriptional regulator [Euryarchaeota archaeon]